MAFGQKKFEILEGSQGTFKYGARVEVAYVTEKTLVVSGGANGSLLGEKKAKGLWVITVAKDGSASHIYQPWQETSYPTTIQIEKGKSIHFHTCVNYSPDTFYKEIEHRRIYTDTGLAKKLDTIQIYQSHSNWAASPHHIAFNDGGGIFADSENTWRIFENQAQLASFIPLPDSIAGYPPRSSYEYKGVCSSYFTLDGSIYLLTKGVARAPGAQDKKLVTGIVHLNSNWDVLGSTYYGNLDVDILPKAMTEGRSGTLYVLSNVGEISEIHKFSADLKPIYEGWPRRLGSDAPPFYAYSLNSTVQDLFVLGKRSDFGPCVASFDHSGNQTILASVDLAVAEGLWQNYEMAVEENYFYIIGNVERKLGNITKDFLVVQKFDRYGNPA